jgi:hypothetical protein
MLSYLSSLLRSIERKLGRINCSNATREECYMIRGSVTVEYVCVFVIRSSVDTCLIKRRL